MSKFKPFNVLNATVLSYDQELIILNAVIEEPSIEKVARKVKISQDIVQQVIWKYKDVISVLVSDKSTEELIQSSYKQFIEKAVSSNRKTVELLTRQIDVLYNEYMDKKNEGVLMKDYLINEVCLIQDKLQKIIDYNSNSIRINREILAKRISGFKDVPSDVGTNGYSENVESVFSRLNPADSIKKDNLTGTTKERKPYQFEAYKGDTFLGTFNSVASFSVQTGLSRQAITKDFVVFYESGITEFKIKEYTFKNVRRIG